MKRWFLVIILALPLLAACGKADGPLQDAVLHYNTLLADGYRRMNMNQLPQAATGERAAKDYYHMAALGEGRVKMDSFLRSIDFNTIKQVADNKALVTTKENWEYKYINIDSGRGGNTLTIHYTARYQLVKQENNWLVAEITILDTDRASDAAELPFFKRPANIPQGSAPQAHP